MLFFLDPMHIINPFPIPHLEHLESHSLIHFSSVIPFINEIIKTPPPLLTYFSDVGTAQRNPTYI